MSSPSPFRSYQFVSPCFTQACEYKSKGGIVGHGGNITGGGGRLIPFYTYIYDCYFDS